ncbi:MAG: hypothetical protein AAF960_13500 [Bacteroidota bacterium]
MKIKRRFQSFLDTHVIPKLTQLVGEKTKPYAIDSQKVVAYYQNEKWSKESIKSTKSYDAFIFTHIPKCGGMSLRHFINQAAAANHIPTDSIYIPGENYQNVNTNLLQLNTKQVQRLQAKQCRIIANHSYYNTHLWYDLKSIQCPFYYTILRAPIDRFVSHYYFFNFKNGQQNCQGVPLNELPVEKLRDILRRSANVQTKYLTGIENLAAFGEKNALKIAKYNLQYGYASFSLLEQLALDLQDLQQKSPDWLQIDATHFPNINQNQHTREVELPIKAFIIEYNRLDIELYEFAQRLKKEAANG